MNITVNTKEIQEAFKKLQKIAPKKSSFKALHNFIVEVEKNIVTMTATDNDVTVKITLKDVYTDVESTSIVLEPETVKLIQKMNSPMLTITENEILSEKRKIKFTILNIEYPNTNNVTYNEELFTVNKNDFLAIAKVKYACSTSDSRPVLKGVCFNSKLTVATDSHRLAKKEIEFDNNIKTNFIVPKYALDHIEKFQNKKLDGNIQVFAASKELNGNIEYKNIKFVFDNIEMQVKVISGTYPEIDRIIPQNFRTEYKINKSKLIEELKLMSELSETLVLKYTNEGINLYAKTSDKRNTLESSIDVEYLTNSDIEYIGFNPIFVLDALEKSEEAIVTFKYTGNTSPFMIDNESLILPIRLDYNEWVA